MDSAKEVVASHPTPAKDAHRLVPHTAGAAPTPAWKQFQGQVVDGKFPLSQYLGGSDHSAVFLTQRAQGEAQKAAIKLVAALPGKADRQLSRWAEAAKMSHPNLLRVFEMGRCRLDKRELLYLVMEYAEENLAQVVGTRALTPIECRQMLPPVLDALGYIHRRGFVHGHIKPANVMAVGEQVKIAIDGLVTAGEPSTQLGTPSVYDPPETATEGLSPAGDVWSLGMLVVEVLTRKVPVLEAGRKEPLLPASAPRPLLDVVRHTLRLDRSRRWNIGEIAARLAPANPLPSATIAPVPQEASAKPRYIWAVLALAVFAVAVFAGVRIRHSRAVKQPSTTAEVSQPVAIPTPAPVTPVAVAPAPAPVAKTLPPAPVAVAPAVLHKVLPRVPQSARDTITGTVRVRVRVAVNRNGNVARASFDSSGPSKYFARLSMQAAREWKFTPAPPLGPREWLLRFEYRQNSTHAFATHL